MYICTTFIYSLMLKRLVDKQDETINKQNKRNRCIKNLKFL